MADAEEIADRALDARMLFAVPIHPQRQQPRVVRRRVRDREPDMHDHAGASQFGQRQRAARGDRAGSRRCRFASRDR